MKRLLQTDPDNPEHLRDLATFLNNLGALYVQRRPDQAAALYRESLAYQEKLATARMGDWDCQNDLALSYNNLGRREAHRPVGRGHGLLPAGHRHPDQARPRRPGDNSPTAATWP